MIHIEVLSGIWGGVIMEVNEEGEFKYDRFDKF
jgi:hypothetical protein